MFYVVLIYSGLPDYVTVITKVKPGLLCVILFFFSWLRTKAYKKDLSELEVVLLLLIVSQSMASLFYANNTGSVKKLLQSEILNIIAFVFGGMLAISSIERLKKYLKLHLFFELNHQEQIVIYLKQYQLILRKRMLIIMM